MQHFDTLRNRVEATARKLTAAHAERHDRTQSLIGTLRQLKERQAAQERQLAWYRERLAPVEQANRQLVGLVKHLLELIERGLGEESLGPLRHASELASAILANDLAMEGRDAAARPWHALEAAGQGVADFEMEEDALISLDHLLELASGDGSEAFDSVDLPADGGSPGPAVFEDVSGALLQHEAREDAASGLEALPDVVQQAAAAAGEPDGTQAGDGAAPSAPLDIRALLQRVEALARTAEAVRMAQGGSGVPGRTKPAAGGAARGGAGQAGAAA